MPDTWDLTPVASGALFGSYSGVTITDFVSGIHDSGYITARWFFKPVQDEILNLISKVNPAASSGISGSNAVFQERSGVSIWDYVGFANQSGAANTVNVRNAGTAGVFSAVTLNTDQFLGRSNSGVISGLGFNSYTAETAIADGDILALYDASASGHRSMTRANLLKEPSFFAYRTTNQSGISGSTLTKITFDTETSPGFDTHGYFASNRYTPLLSGKYMFTVSSLMTQIASGATSIAILRFNNGSTDQDYYGNYQANGALHDILSTKTMILSMDGVDDWVEAWVYHTHSSGRDLNGDKTYSNFTGCRVSP